MVFYFDKLILRSKRLHITHRAASNLDADVIFSTFPWVAAVVVSKARAGVGIKIKGRSDLDCNFPSCERVLCTKTRVLLFVPVLSGWMFTHLEFYSMNVTVYFLQKRYTNAMEFVNNLGFI